jgi:hypothetical protein
VRRILKLNTNKCWVMKWPLKHYSTSRHFIAPDSAVHLNAPYWDPMSKYRHILSYSSFSFLQNFMTTRKRKHRITKLFSWASNLTNSRHHSKHENQRIQNRILCATKHTTIHSRY